MDLVDEQDVVRLEVREHRGEIAGAFEHRPGRLAQVHVELVCNDVRERRLAETGRSEDEHVIERVAAAARSGHEDLHLLADGVLADVVVEPARTDCLIGGRVLAVRCCVDESLLFHHDAREPDVVRAVHPSRDSVTGDCGEAVAPVWRSRGIRPVRVTRDPSALRE